MPFLMSPLWIQAESPALKEDKPTQFIQYNNRAVIFTPFHQSYERIKTDAFYAGVEAFLVANKKNHTLLNGELRMGYGFFFNRRDHLIPFAGAGYLQDFFTRHHHLRHNPGIAYGALGFQYTHEFNSVFNLGINAKIFAGSPMSQKHLDWGSSVVGGSELSIPITFRFGRSRHWDFRLEPFNWYLHGTKASRDYRGCIVTLGYRFF